MESQQFEFKLNDPIKATDQFGTVGGYYEETIVDKKDIWIRFVKRLGKGSKARFLRPANLVSPATNEEVLKLNS